MAEPIDLNSDELQAAIAKAAEERAQVLVKAEVASATEGLINKNAELLSEKKEYKSRYDSITDKYDFDKIDESLAEAEEIRKAEMSHEQRWEYRRDEMLQGFDVERKEHSVQIDKMADALQRNLIDAQLTSAIVEAGGRPYLAQDTLVKSIKVVAEGDDYKARIMKDGNPRMAGATGEFMTIPQLVQEFKDDERYGSWFGTSGASGGGVQSNQHAVVGSEEIPRSRSSMTPKEKGAFTRQYGQEAFLKLPK